MPTFAATTSDCTEANTLTAPADNASDVQVLLNDDTISIVCLSGTFGLEADTPLSYTRGVTLFGLPGATLDGQSQTRILEGGALDTLSVQNLTFINGVATEGGMAVAGGAISAFGPVVVEGSRFNNNTSLEKGGAIAFGGPYSIEIERSTFVGNSTGTLGGAIFAEVGVEGVSITSSTFLNNTAVHGGAVYDTGSVNIINSTFVGNRATGTTGEGGAILARGGTVSFSTFLNNTASAPLDGEDIPGEAIYLEAESDSPDLDLTANIFAGLTLRPQLGVGSLPEDPGPFGQIRDGGANVFSTASEPDLPIPISTSVFSASVAQIFGASPQLGNNGGSTQTVALVTGSRAVGIVLADALALTTDQRGFPRPGAGSALRDAGAFELQAVIPGQVNGLAVTPGNTSVALSWSAASNDGDSPITDYVIEQNSGSGWVRVVDGVSTATSFTVTGLTNGTSYQFRVSAVNAVGSGVVSVVSSSVIPSTVPGQVASLSATQGNASVALSWSAPSSTGGSPITDYVIEQNSGSGWVQVVDGVSVATSFTVTGLANGTSYQFRVSAVNAVGSGLVSAVSSSVTPAAPTASTAPATPAVLAATGSSPAAGWLAGGAALLMALGSTLMVLKRRRFR